MKLISWVVLGIGTFAFAGGDPVCVRNFTNDGGVIPCHTAPREFAWVVPIQPSPYGVCTRQYVRRYCELSPTDFEWVTSEEGTPICVQNMNQPSIGANACANGDTKTFASIRR